MIIEESKRNKKNKKKIIALVGGSGSGKTTIAHELEKKGFQRLVTTTTRKKRPGEVNRVDYHFVDREEFETLNKVEENEYAGNLYGLTTKEIESKLKNSNQLVIVVDINGARSLQKAYPNETQIVFIKISKQLMIKRLKRRGSVPSEIEDRLRQAEKGNEFNTPESVHLVLENKNLSKTVNEIIRLTN